MGHITLEILFVYWNYCDTRRILIVRCSHMAQLQKSVVTLRIMGDDLIPDEITTLLGASPTHAETKGDKIVGKKTSFVRIAKTGMWRLWALDREPEDMDGQIHEILNEMTADLIVWRTITKKYHADLFCGLFMRWATRG